MSPRGRRPAGQDTRGDVLAAARRLFARDGYTKTSLRGIAREAGVDAAMVHHWFTSKGELFMMSLASVPLNPAERIAHELQAGPIEQAGERIARAFLTFWDEHPGGFGMLAHAIVSNDQALEPLSQFLQTEVFGRAIASIVSGPDAHLRASLVGSQIIGVGLARYVITLEPAADADRETLVAALGPTLQRYLTGDISGEATNA